jgi:hypothetical protein
MKPMTSPHKKVRPCIDTKFLCKSFLFSQVILCTFFSSGNLNAQVRNTGQLYIAGNVFANTDFSNASSAAYQNNGNFFLTGNFTNDQPSVTQGTGTTSFIGTTLQRIDGAQDPVFNNVYYNNPSGVQMNLNTSMGGIISPVAGSLFFNGFALTMGGQIDINYTNIAAFNVTNTSDLIIKGQAAQGNGLYFDSTANTLHDLTLITGSDAVLGNALNITAGTAFGTVIADGDLDAAGFLTIKSDANGYARIAASTGTIINNATVERFIPARRAWRFIAVPFSSSAQSINQAWQEGYTNTNLNCPTQFPGTPGFGTEITYNGLNGYDLNTTNLPSIKVWENNAWAPLGSTLTPKITDYSAYCIFVRGDRSICLIQATRAIPNNTVLRATGILYQTGGINSVTKHYAGNTGDFFFIGNPYASAINLENVINGSRPTDNFGFDLDKVWVWDPKLAGNFGVGGYVTYSAGLWVPAGASYPSGTNNLPYIQSGQGFMVQTNSTNASIQFQDDDKTAAQANVFGLRANTPFPVVYTNLMQQDSVILLDGVATAFSSSFSETIGPDDAAKQWNIDENIAQVRGKNTLAIEFRPVPKLTDTLFYRLYLRQQPYVLKIFSALPEDLPVHAWLADKYLKTQTEINLSDTGFYSFIPNADTNSYRNRFMLVFNVEGKNRPLARETAGNFDDALSTSGGVNIFPNPIHRGNKINLQFSNLQKGRYTIFVSDISGRSIFSQTIEYNGGKTAYSLPLKRTEAAGNYIVKITNEDGYLRVLSLIIDQ